MAGFFGFFDYTKPGPGVPNPEDAPKKARILVFLEILQRKFWNLIKINLMFNIFNLPAVILGMFVALSLFPNIIPEAFSDTDTLISDVFLKFILLSVLLCIPMITVGPAQAGFTYILRNYCREEHAFIWGDFKESALKNFKQSTIVSTIGFVVTLLMVWSIRAYIILGGENIIMIIGTTFMIMMFVIFMMMHMYIYPMLVTFNLTIKQLYKNALIFAIIKLIPNVGILLLCLLIIFLTFGAIIPFNQIIGLILYAFFTVSLIGLITNFYVYPKLMKYMAVKEEPEAGEDEEYEDEEDEEDNDKDNVEAENDNEENTENETDVIPSDNEDKSNEDKNNDENGEDGSSEVKRYF
ncbi:MAG: DUF624 domain-containing protein [Ruminiclostridium sp.]|nr:DUF624 domain-containing protein [Ruminiclostridium sp.]